MAWAKGYSGASAGGRTAPTRRKAPVYEQNTTTCDVCGAKPSWPCKTKRNNNMKETHATLRAKSSLPAEPKKPRANAKKPARPQTPPAKDWGDGFAGEWGKP